MTDQPTKSTMQANETRQSSKIRVENVHKQFGRITALEDISFSIEENEIFSVIGDNGAGKSTLMKTLCGLHEPTEGAIYLDGEPVKFENPGQARDRGIETVYQDLALMNDLDAATNIFVGQFPTKGFGPIRVIDWDTTYESAQSIVQNRLKKDIDVRSEVEFLSGGERQLIAIARALAFDPDVIILDEPTSALSIEASALVQDTIRTLREEGHTIIIISHNIEEVIGLADRIGVLHQGRLVDVVNSDAVDVDMLRNMLVSGQRDKSTSVA